MYSISLNGKNIKFNNLKEIAKHINLAYGTFIDRIKVQGKTPQEAVDMGSPKSNHTPVSGYVNGEYVSFSSITKAAKAYGVSGAKVSKYLKNKKTLEDALKNEKLVQVIVNGKKLKFQNRAAACLYLGLNAQTVCQRIKRGWTLLEALELEKTDKKIGGTQVKVSFEFNGKKYDFDSITNAARYFKKDYQLVYPRYQTGWLIEEALDLIPRKTTSNKDKAHQIYLLTNKVNGMMYVGQTCLELEERLANHIKDSKNQKSGTRKIEIAINEYGPDNFEIKLIKLCSSQHSANVNETKYIEKLNTLSPTGYNMTSGGSGTVTCKRIIIEGQVFDSYKDAAEHYGVSENILARRMATGRWTPEQAIDIEESDNHGSVRFFQGKKFTNESEMTKHYGVKQETYRKRIERGLSREEALGVKKIIKTEAPKANRQLYCDHLGNSFKSLKKMAEHHGINRGTFYSRLSSGASIEDALAKPIESSKEVCDHLGNQFKSISEMCRHYGITRSSWGSRTKDLKWSLEKTLTTPVSKSIKPAIDHTGKKYKCENDMARDWGVKTSTFRERIKRGWSIERALSS